MHILIHPAINGWMNENTTIDWVENVIKPFTFGKRRLFTWDHLVQSVKELFSKRKIDPVFILGGATGYIQSSDVSWNKPIKDQTRKIYDQWMDEGPNTHTKGGNMLGPPLKLIVQWILKA